ncbi:hypothetical protein R69608_05084 [Paraburkholderia nemoris]|uniref:hypothetical protein n=1 Tax=Paraburkholderia nemoris TaxID=2793076 RepID=UPI0019114E8C|nr:hypothetical protein [Paraburkholderia nemoris]MBK5149709.1 hypothetical protein [Burkholderia sp. R-69608]CAE6938315.1 hypothetical protein R69608_05084 [Paraburkholderia nemoris]
MTSDQTFTISTQDIDKLQDEIKKNFKEVDFAGGPKEEFCKVWPAASEGLAALKAILAVVPGVNVFAGPAISIVIAAGNAASSAVCPTKAG